MLENPRVKVSKEAIIIPVELEIPLLPAEIMAEPILSAQTVEEPTIEGVHERIQVEVYHEAKEAEARIEEQLEAPP